MVETSGCCFFAAPMKKRFEMLYQTYRDAVYGYLYYMCREEELAQDPWGLKIARNTFLSYARKKQPMLLGEKWLDLKFLSSSFETCLDMLS